MSTVAELPGSEVPQIAPYLITSDQFERMIKSGDFPEDARVFLWDGRLYEKMAKTLAHAGVQSAITNAIGRRLPKGLFIGPENPVRLDPTHLPLPDLIVARGSALEIHDSRYPDGRDVVLVVEIAVSSLSRDLGSRLARYASTLPLASYVVADITHRQILVHSNPRSSTDTESGGYTNLTVVKPGEALKLRFGDIELDPIPYEEVMR
jgi:Uma2 family endonuclease